MPKRWIFLPPAENLEALGRTLGAGGLVCQVLANRGMVTAEECGAFLNPGYMDLHRPEDMPGLTKAAERIVAAVRGGEKIAIYGDYDVDGLTAAALLYQCLELAGTRATLYVPHRIEEGYGLHSEALEQLAAAGHKVVVTVDCGVTSIKEAARARELGLDLIITDHHEPEAEIPAAYAVVNPKLPGSTYPFRDLAGVGVAFKLAWAIGLMLAGNNKDKKCAPAFQRFLTDATSLAALGTIADVVPLVGENRALAAMGLKALSSRRYHHGLEAIVKSARTADGKVKEHDVGFIIGPRLNAAGRMGSAHKALRLLTEAGPEEAMAIATELEEENRRRQEVEREIFNQAVGMVEKSGGVKERFSLVLASEQWHAGVIGIVASRLVERYYRPTLLIAIEEGQGQGSGRSIPGFSLFKALGATGGHLRSFGGHDMAAGCRLAGENVAAFAAAFEAHAKSALRPEDLVAAVKIDATTEFAALGITAVRELSRLAPFGQGNPRPVLAVRDCRLVRPPERLGKDGSHLALTLTQGGICLRALYWKHGRLAETLAGAQTLDIACRPMINKFNGRESVELELADVHPGGYCEPTDAG